MEKNGNKNAIRGDLTRGFEFLKYQVKRVTSCELLEEKQFFLTILNRLQFLSFEPCLKISLIVILLSYSHEHNICIKFIFATMYINFNYFIYVLVSEVWNYFFAYTFVFEKLMQFRKVRFLLSKTVDSIDFRYANTGYKSCS